MKSERGAMVVVCLATVLSACGSAETGGEASSSVPASTVADVVDSTVAATTAPATTEAAASDTTVPAEDEATGDTFPPDVEAAIEAAGIDPSLGPDGIYLAFLSNAGQESGFTVIDEAAAISLGRQTCAEWENEEEDQEGSIEEVLEGIIETETEEAIFPALFAIPVSGGDCVLPGTLGGNRQHVRGPWGRGLGLRHRAPGHTA